jgi:hypothetical protein
MTVQFNSVLVLPILKSVPPTWLIQTLIESDNFGT